MISPACRLLTRSGPRAAIHCAYVCMLPSRKRSISSNTFAISGSTAEAVRKISKTGRSSVEMPAMNFANSSICLRWSTSSLTACASGVQVRRWPPCRRAPGEGR